MARRPTSCSTPETAPGYIEARPTWPAWSTPPRSTCTEVGDGNLNLVFVCQDAAGRGRGAQAGAAVRAAGRPDVAVHAAAGGRRGARLRRARRVRRRVHAGPARLRPRALHPRARGPLRPPRLARRAHRRRAPRRRGRRGWAATSGGVAFRTSLFGLEAEGAQGARGRGDLARAVRDHRGPRADRAVLRRRAQLVPGRARATPRARCRRRRSWPRRASSSTRS